MSHSTGTDPHIHLNPETPTDTVYWAARDGSWGMCQRGDLVIVDKEDITPRDLADIIDAHSDAERYNAIAAAKAKTYYR